MKTGKAKRRTASKLMTMLLAAALFITIMPLGFGAAFADDSGEPAAAVLTVSGEGLIKTLTFEDIEALMAK